ncbi:MAG: dihydrofolate reductase family protein [Sphingobacterium sp.]
MKKIILNLAMTLDGYIEGPNGEVDWCIMDEDMDFIPFLDCVDTIFYGRVSYDIWGDYQAKENASATEKALWAAVHAKAKFVFSHSDRRDSKATFLSGDLLDQVGKLKNQKGKDIWLYGGANLIKTFIDLDLIDVYRISLHPVVLGNGKPLFENLPKPTHLKLIDTHVFRSGVVELVYENIGRH